MILIDDRTGAKDLNGKLSSPHKLTHLEFADIAFRGNGPEGPVMIGIERKQIRDLVDSISSGRLSGHQVLGLVNSYDYSYILVEGAFKIGKDNYIRRPAGPKKWVVIQLGDRPLTATYIYNYLNELAIMCGIQSVFHYNTHRACVWLDGLYSWWNKKWDDHHALNQFFAPPPPARAFFRPPKLLVRQLKEIDGVGWDKAKVIGRSFDCIHSVCHAEAKDLTGIKGIGKVLAQRILDSLNGGGK